MDCDAAVLQYLERLFRDEGGEITSVLYENKNCAARITRTTRRRGNAGRIFSDQPGKLR